MLCAVTAPRLRTMMIALAVSATLAGCASTTSGTGSLGGSASTASSSPDFPTGSVPASSATGDSGATAATGSSSAARPSGSGGVHSAPSTPLRTVTVHSADGVTYVVKMWAEVQNATCFDHAYGSAIVTFLTKHPCAGLRRHLATTTVNGLPVGIAETATGFPGPANDPYRYAGQFSKLELADGTGSINDLLREGYRLPQGPTSIPSSEAFNVLGQDGGVTVWDVWYLDRPTPGNEKALITMTRDLFLQF